MTESRIKIILLTPKNYKELIGKYIIAELVTNDKEVILWVMKFKGLLPKKQSDDFNIKKFGSIAVEVQIMTGSKKGIIGDMVLNFGASYEYFTDYTVGILNL